MATGTKKISERVLWALVTGDDPGKKLYGDETSALHRFSLVTRRITITSPGVLRYEGVLVERVFRDQVGPADSAELFWGFERTRPEKPSESAFPVYLKAVLPLARTLVTYVAAEPAGETPRGTLHFCYGAKVPERVELDH